LQKLIAEIPTSGPARLMRKLSVDVNVLIPKTVEGANTREKMISMAVDLAARRGMPLYAPNLSGLEKPPFETKYQYGFRVIKRAPKEPREPREPMNLPWLKYFDRFGPCHLRLFLLCLRPNNRLKKIVMRSHYRLTRTRMLRARMVG
jgi:hypothetical protein